MDPNRRIRLESAGMDVDDALKRVMGSEALLEKLLTRFLADKNYPELLEGLSERDRVKAFTASHTLKGICGNLSMTELYGLFSEQVEALRSEDFDKADGLMEKISPAFENITATIGGSVDEEK